MAGTERWRVWVPVRTYEVFIVTAPNAQAAKAKVSLRLAGLENTLAVGDVHIDAVTPIPQTWPQQRRWEIEWIEHVDDDAPG